MCSHYFDGSTLSCVRMKVNRDKLFIIVVLMTTDLRSSRTNLLHTRFFGGLCVGAVHVVTRARHDVDPGVLGHLPERGQVAVNPCGGVLHYGAPAGLPVRQQLVPHGAGLLLQQQVLVAAVRVLSQPVHVLHLERLLRHRLVAWRRREVAALEGHGQVLMGHGSAQLARVQQTQDTLDLPTQL